jgi:PRD1 phage membrane DNA delivery
MGKDVIEGLIAVLTAVVRKAAPRSRRSSKPRKGTDMNGRIFESITTIALAIVSLAVIAVLVGRQSQTPQVLQAGGSAFSESLRAAEAPVLGGFTEAPGYGAYL